MDKKYDTKTYAILILAILLVVAVIGWVQAAENSGSQAWEQDLQRCGDTSEEDRAACASATEQLKSEIIRYSKLLNQLQGNQPVENSPTPATSTPQG